MNDKDNFRVFNYLVLGVAALYFFVLSSFLIWQTFSQDTWFIELHKSRYVALVGIPFAAFGSLVIVMALGFRYGEKMELKAIGIEFKGTSGPVLLFVLVFLAFITALRLLWPLAS